MESVGGVNSVRSDYLSSHSIVDAGGDRQKDAAERAVFGVQVWLPGRDAIAIR